MTDDDNDKDYKKVETEKKAHALEKWLNLEEGSTEVDRVKYDFPMEKSDRYDPKDREIEEQAHEVFKEAMGGYHTLDSLLQEIEPKYRARMAEVALAYLNTALSATETKNKQKESLEKLRLQKEKILKDGENKSSRKIFVTADRNKLLKELRKDQDDEDGIIDVSPEDMKGEEDND